MTDWALRRTRQCVKCPWIVGNDPYDIPSGYDLAKHRDLRSTIAEPGVLHHTLTMACHESHNSHCVGWLANQLGPGQNLMLRLRMRSCTNGDKIKLRGEQHPTFEETLPK